MSTTTEKTVTVCTRRPFASDHAFGLCPTCGHLNAVHVGTVECPVCRLVEMTSTAGRRRTARAEGRTDG